MNNDFNIPIDLDEDVEYEGNTEQEQILNKELLKTTLELNMYQDNYDVMHTVDEIKQRIEEYKSTQSDEYVPSEVIFEYDIRIQELEWVLNNSRTTEEKWKDIPRASKEDVKNMIKDFNERYKQLSIFDIMEQNNN